MPKLLLKKLAILGVTLGLLCFGTPVGVATPLRPVTESLGVTGNTNEISADAALYLDASQPGEEPTVEVGSEKVSVSDVVLRPTKISESTAGIPHQELQSEFESGQGNLDYAGSSKWVFANLRFSAHDGKKPLNRPVTLWIRQTGGKGRLAFYRLKSANQAEAVMLDPQSRKSKFFATSDQGKYVFDGANEDIIQLVAVGTDVLTCEIEPMYGDGEDDEDWGKSFTLTVNASGKNLSESADSGLTQLRQGHMDVFHVDPTDDGGLSLLIKEDITGRGVRRAAESAEMIMGTNWYETGLNWKLPGCENAGFTSASLHSGDMLSPGLSSSGLDNAGFSEVKVEFTSVTAPQGGRVALVLTSSLQGGSQPILEDNRYYIEPGARLKITTHQHFQWLFTKPGTYQFRAKAIGQLHGQTVESPEVTYTWKTEGQPDNYDPVGIDQNCTPHIPNSGATPGAPHEKPQKPHADETPSSRPVFDHGHMDLFNVSARGGKLVLETKEDVSGSGVIRAPESYFLRLRDNTKYDIPADMQGDLVPSGYLLQENGSNQTEALFPGWDTNGVAPDFTSIDLTFQEVKGPGKAFLFVPGQFNVGIRSTLASGGYELRTGEVVNQPYPAHKHVYWLFEKPGVYTMKVQASGENQAGIEVKSNVGTYTWVVGEETPLPDGAAADGGGEPGLSGGVTGTELVGKTGKGGKTVTAGPKGTKKKAAKKKNSRKKKSQKGLKSKSAPKKNKKSPASPKRQGVTSEAPTQKTPNTKSLNNIPVPSETSALPESVPDDTYASPANFDSLTAGFPNPADFAPGSDVESSGLPLSSGFSNASGGIAGIPPQNQSPSSPAPVPSLAESPQISAAGTNTSSPYGSAVVTEPTGMPSTAAFLTGTGIAAGGAGLTLLGLRWRRLRLGIS